MIPVIGGLLIASATIFVDPHGNDFTGCGSKHSPCGSIGFAVEQAEDGGTVQVASGRYTPAHNMSRFMIVDKSVHIKGKSALLDCQNKVSGGEIHIASGMHVVIQGLTFFNCTGSTSNPWNFSYRTNPCPSDPSHDWCHGQCYCDPSKCRRAGGVSIINKEYEQWPQCNFASCAPVENAVVHFVDCNWTECSGDKGAAVQYWKLANFTNTMVKFDACTFHANHGTLQGSAIYTNLGLILDGKVFDKPWFTDSAITIENTNFTKNDGVGQGTINVWHSNGAWNNFSLELTRVRMEENAVANVGAAVALWGGDSLRNPNFVRVRESVFEQNNVTVIGPGGAMCFTFLHASERKETPADGGFEYWDYKNIVEIDDSQFIANEADGAGAYASGNGRHIFRNVSFVRNKARHSSGAIVLSDEGGDSSLEAYGVTFDSNSALYSQTLKSQGSGPLIFVNTTFKFLGSDTGASEIDIRSAGMSAAANDTEFSCPPGHVMQVPTRTTPAEFGFAYASGGIKEERFNINRRHIGSSYMSMTCAKCPPGRYSTSSPKLKGPFSSLWCDLDDIAGKVPYANACVNQYGNTFKELVTPSNVTNQQGETFMSACRPCPFGGNCTGGSDISVSSLVYGYLCNSKEQTCVDTFTELPDSDEWEVKLTDCPSGYCEQGRARPWQNTCLEHRQGNLCGECEKGYSERWFGSGPCVENSRCTSAWWLGPLLPVVLFAGAVYCYRSAQKGLYTVPDSLFFFFQILPLVAYPGPEFMSLGILISVLGFNDSALTVRSSSSSSKNALVTFAHDSTCLAPGFDAKFRLMFGCLTILIPPLVILVHFLANTCCQMLKARGDEILSAEAADTHDNLAAESDPRSSSELSVQIESGVLEVRNSGRSICRRYRLERGLKKYHDPVCPLTAGLYKAIFFCYSNVLAALVKLATCHYQPGYGDFGNKYSFYYGNHECHSRLAPLFALVALSPLVLALFSHCIGAARERRQRTSDNSSRNACADAVYEVQQLHQVGFRKGMWWVPFVLAGVRGSIVLVLTLVPDIAIATLIRSLLLTAVLTFLSKTRPFLLDEPYKESGLKHRNPNDLRQQHIESPLTMAVNDYQIMVVTVLLAISFGSLVFASLQVAAVDWTAVSAFSAYVGAMNLLGAGSVTLVGFLIIVWAKKITKQKDRVDLNTETQDEHEEERYRQLGITCRLLGLISTGFFCVMALARRLIRLR